MSQELITYIVLGSSERLKNLKKPDLDNSEEYIFANFTDKDQIVLILNEWAEATMTLLGNENTSFQNFA